MVAVQPVLGNSSKDGTMLYLFIFGAPNIWCANAIICLMEIDIIMHNFFLITDFYLICSDFY
jgi:hypothetical protein